MRTFVTRTMPVLALAAFAVLGLSRPADAGLRLVLQSGADTTVINDAGTGVIGNQSITVGNFTVNIDHADAPPAPGTVNGLCLNMSQQSVDVSSTGGGDLTITESATDLSFAGGGSVATLESVATASKLIGGGAGGATYSFQSWVDQANTHDVTGTAFSSGLQGPFSSITLNDTGAISVPVSVVSPFSVISRLVFHAADGGQSVAFTGTTTVCATPEPATFGPAVLAAFSGIVFGVRRIRRSRATA